MNKHKIIRCFVIVLATIVCITEAGSRKRYRKKKEFLNKTTATHMDVSAHTDQNNDDTTSSMSRIKNATQTATGMPQIQNRINTPLQYDDPFVDSVKSYSQEDTATTATNMPLETAEDEQDSIELNFENADLQNFAKQIEDVFEITFITDESISPLAQGKKTIKNNKLSFKTHKPLSKKEMWNLFVTFLDIAGFAITPQADPKVFRIASIESARKSPLPTFIGVDSSTLPDNDELIRYVYFLENASTDTIKDIIDPLRSSSSQGFIILREHKGFILTDKAYNIKMLMSIVKELDKVSIPESMSVLKLRNADARQVQELYKELLPKEEAASRFFTKKQPTSLFFPENTRIIADPRTNTLILLGPKNAIKKIESFITQYIDVELDQAYSPLYTYQLKYADAETVADIMSKVTAFGGETEAGRYGGVRGKDQYMKPMAFIAEKETNKLIIKGPYEDYLKSRAILDRLDIKQPQAGIQVLIVTVDLNDTKSLGTQLRSREPGPNGLLGNNIKFQTSGLYGTSGVVTNPDPSTGTNRLLGNLLNLVTGAVPGTSLLSLGRDAFGVWGIFQALQSIANAEVVSNPFILATNNAKATVALGEQRRIQTALVVGANNQSAFDADDAKLEVSITPQINSDGMIGLTINITINEFTNRVNPNDATQSTRQITTNAIVANKEVLALGGLIRDNVQTIETKVPILGDIPILGWFFKNKRQIKTKQSLLVLIETNIMPSGKGQEMQSFTREHIDEYQSTIDAMEHTSSDRDPIHRWFFEDKAFRAQQSAEGLIFERHQRKEDALQESQIKEEEKKHATFLEKENNKEEKVFDTEVQASGEISVTNNNETKDAYSTRNRLIETMHSKKRAQPSLTELLSNTEIHA